MAGKIRVLIPEEEVNKKISEITAQISKDCEGRDIHLICILKGSVFFTCKPARRITVPASLDLMSVSSYGAGTVFGGIVRVIKGLDKLLDSKDIPIVEDIIDSGRTLAYLIEVLKQRNSKWVQLYALLDKSEHRVRREAEIAYTCFTIPDEFIVGYGPNYDQKCRNLPCIRVVEQQITTIRT